LGVDRVPNNVAFVLSEEVEGPVVFRVVLSEASIERVTQQVERISDEFSSDEKLAPLVRAGRLGVLVLADRKPFLDRIWRRLRGSRHGELPLSERVHVKVGPGPSPETISSALKPFRGNKRGTEADGG
jgi:hypothetical protein